MEPNVEQHLPPASHMLYWGKLDRNGAVGEPYHLLAYHSIDVATVGEQLLKVKPRLVESIAAVLRIDTDEFIKLFVFALVLHDLGKFASAFQGLNPYECERLIKPSARKPYCATKFRHDSLALYFWETLKNSDGIRIRSLDNLQPQTRKKVLKQLLTLFDCVFGHHGKPIRRSHSIVEMEGYTELHNVSAATSFIQAADELIQPTIDAELFLDKDWLQRLRQVSWHLAGLAVLADWIGSNNRHFAYCTEVMPLMDYWERSTQIAQTAVQEAELGDDLAIAPFRSIREHHGFDPTPLQQWAETVPVDASPQLFILEDVTGSGKTEAALALTHRLMEAGAADGFYFGLPTMATSNAMFDRVADLYQNMYGSSEHRPSIVLAHGARDMHAGFRDAVLAGQSRDGEYTAGDATATVQCTGWLADSRKKALLAPVGVGTIDQALLAVLPRRHQSLRLLGLNRKVLIFDEVHAADEYMFELLECLLNLHLYQGGCAILLTATLSIQQRERLCRAWQLPETSRPPAPRLRDFPLATKVALDQAAPLEQALATRSDVERTVAVDFLHSVDACVEQVLLAVEQGHCVVWVRNSVDEAIEAFRAIREQLLHPEHCLLFHSRFTLEDRKRIEGLVLHTFGKQSTGADRAGRVLISTQVFQESLDADADLMISDICPIDDLIQRAGRLHRHTRDHSGCYRRNIRDERAAPKLLVHAPEWEEQPSADWLQKSFLNTQYVYRSPGRLWLGMRELRQLGAIKMPDNARRLIEAVYGEDAYDAIPPSLQNQENQVIGEEYSKAAKAASQVLDWQCGYCQKSAPAWYEDDIEISTRYSDMETVEVLLVKETEDGRLQPWAGEGKFAVQLSCVKVSKTKYADKLAPVPERLKAAEATLKKNNPRAKYLQCWAPDYDSFFAYDGGSGFHTKEQVEMLR